MARGELPQDYCVCVPAHNGLIDRITRHAEDLLKLGRELSCSIAMSPRESEVLKEVMRNRGNKEIADRLNISIRTVKFHVSSLLGKFGVPSRWDLIQKAERTFGNQEYFPEPSSPAPRNLANPAPANARVVPLMRFESHKQNRVIPIRQRLHPA
ncbi:MAG TPA: helix-turn-helix transcriptional regulator [Candidatus Acidoferrales bacterium]|nr:helix-turn-helix transcriptional regulator [Candidatus Acidoferrales bacterium]